MNGSAGPISDANRSARAREGPTGTSERELADDRWTLIKVAVTDPSRTYQEVNDAGPGQVFAALRPYLKVDFLIPLQIRRPKFPGFSFVLDGLFAGPTDHERTRGPRDEVWIFTRILHRVEDQLQARRDRKPDQRRLRRIVVRNCAEDAQLEFRDECVQLRFVKH